MVSEVSYGRYRVDFTDGGRIIAGDAGFVAMTGYTQQDIEKGTLLFPQLLLPEDCAVYTQKLQEVLAKRSEAFLEHRLQKKDGTAIYVFCYGQMAISPENGHLMSDIVITDVSEVKLLESRYSEKELELDMLIQNIPGGVAILEVTDDLRVLYGTNEFYRMLGHTWESYLAQTDGAIRCLVFPADYDTLRNAMNQSLQKHEPCMLETRFYKADGTMVWLDIHSQLLRYQNGKPLFYAALFDITESKKRDADLRLETERYRLIVENTNELIYDYDRLTDTMHLPQNCNVEVDGELMHDIPRFVEEHISAKIIHPEDFARFALEMQDALFAPKTSSIDLRMRLQNNVDYEWYRIICMSVVDEQGKVYRVFGRMSSIDKLKRLKKTIHEDKVIIERLSTTDPVTGLLNRATFKERTIAYLAQSDPEKEYALVYSDINDFSYVNDNFGYDSGNTMLFELGAVINSHPGTVYACRINSDFFLSFMEGDSREQMTESVRRRDLQFGKRQRDKYPASELMVTTGICFVDQLDCDVTVEMDNANLARRKAKQNKSDPLCVYYQDLRIARTREKIIAAELHGAIENRNVELFLQPKFMLDTRSIIGAEALVRWRNPDGSYRMPVEFIEILEKVGYIIELDFFMYEEVLKCLKRWQALGTKLIPISVNFSRLHNNYTNFVERVVTLCRQYQVDPRYIEIEVTESAFASDVDMMMSNMTLLRDAGFSIDIDDFGKGYSSLSFLMGSPIDTVKVDKAFVDGIEVSEKHREYIKQMCMLIKATEKEIIFEGVETQNQADFLCSCGFTKAQGWLLDKAVPVPVFEERYLDLGQDLTKDKECAILNKN